jgi:FkbM family methyltransferase
MGWNSLTIDADSRVIEQLKSLRTNVVHTLVSDHEGTEKFVQTVEAGISHVNQNGNVTVECKTLNTLLEENNISEVTLLDIDVEGHELEVCRGLDWNKYKPQIVIIEYISPAGGNIEDKLIKYFTNLGAYALVHRTQANLIFVRNETI